MFLDLFDAKALEDDSEDETENETHRHDEDALSIEEEDVSSHHCSILLLSNQASPIYTKESQLSEYSEEEDVSSSHIVHCFSFLSGSKSFSEMCT